MSQSVGDEHLDHALSEEFEGKGAAIHALKVSSAHFRNLLERNHELWKQIQQIQKEVQPASDAHLESLEKQRLVVLDSIATELVKAN